MAVYFGAIISVMDNAKEILSKFISVAGMISLISGLVMLFLNWRVGVALILGWVTLISLSVLFEPQEAKYQYNKSTSSAVDEIAKNEFKKINNKALVAFVVSGLLLVLFILFHIAD